MKRNRIQENKQKKERTRVRRQNQTDYNAKKNKTLESNSCSEKA